MKIVDPGHTYLLKRLDSIPSSFCTLEFVKRNWPPEKYPGNIDSHAGTTIQEVLRACINRLQYVNNQIDSPHTYTSIAHLRFAIWELECRAAKRHGRILLAAPYEIEKLPVCSVCGHIECKEHNES